LGCDPDLTEEAYHTLLDESDSKWVCSLCDDKKLKTLLDAKGTATKIVQWGSKRLGIPPLSKKE